ncbi:MAG: putative metal-binding motif-containing protein, partial [Saprospiraceae bacterium]|nr:putative metal-binding motif-containing protein [Saprospiraceae bacterium]
MQTAFLPCLFFFFCLVTPHSVYTQCNTTAAEIPNNGIDEDCDGLDDIFLALPPYIYMVEGQDFELYFRNLILSKHPQDYVFSVNTPLNGVNSGQKWVFTPAANNIGELPLSVTVKSNGGQMLASGTAIVRISPATAPPDISPKKLILFGHSFFDQGYLPKYLYDRTHQPGNPPITFHGKKMSWANALARHEGYGGRPARWFFEDWSSPIRYGDKVNLRKYFDEVISPGGRPDWLIYHLDINEFCGYSSLPGTTLPEIDDFIINYWNQYRLIDSIHVAAPNTKIAICLSPMPNAREGTFQITFGGNPVLSNRWRWQKIISRLLFKNMERYGNREEENIFLIPEQLDLDDFADYEPGDAIHPDPPDQNINTHCGYMEIAKSIYAWIRWAEFHPGASSPTLYTYFRDADGDGYGNPLQTQMATNPPAGYTNQSGDCDDTQPSVHPNATELCGNNLDDDCDGAIDEDLTAPLAGCKNTVQLPLNASGVATLTIAQVNQGSFDACSTVTMSLSRSQFSCADLGQNNVTLNLHDVAGNTNSCQTKVQVTDNLAPVVQCPATSLDLGPSGQVTASLTQLGLQAIDNCGPTTWQTTANLHFTCQQANTTVALPLVAKDNSGNTATCTFQLLITNTADGDGDGVSNCLDACPNDPTTATLLQFFPDADGDGFGSHNSDAIFACAPPSGTSTNSLDCDD